MARKTNWGGKRVGSGRPRGAPNKKTRELLERISSEGWTPLDLMLHVMREYAAAGRWKEAAALAKDVAPYVHPKLATVQYADDESEEESARPILHVHFVSPKSRLESGSPPNTALADPPQI